MSVNSNAYPSDWKIKSLGAIANGFLSGGTPSTKNEEFWCGSVPWITSKWLNSRLYLESGEKCISEVAIEKSATTIIPRNSLIFATRVGVGKVAINSIDLAINQDLAGVLVDADRYDLRFLAYQLRSNRVQMEVLSHKRGATIQGITRDNLKQIEICLPPLAEQRKIAHILSTVQRAIEMQERIIQTTTELKKAFMKKLFTEGLRGERQKETEIGLVPESWELLPIGDLFETQLGKMLSQKAKVGTSPKPYLRNKNVQWEGIGTGDILYMDFNERETEKFRLRKGDLLVCEGGEVGRAAIWNGEIDECYYQKALHRLRPKDSRISNEFMAYWMMFSFFLNNTYGVTGTRTTIAHLPEIKLKPLLVPVPSVEEQQEIIGALRSVDEKAQNHSVKLHVIQDLFRTLLHELMTASIRVDELDLPAMDAVA